MQFCASKIDIKGDLSFNGFFFFHLDYFAAVHSTTNYYIHSICQGISNILCALFYPITRMEKFPQRIRPVT